MSLERVDRLADRVLDGEASPEERAELERLVAGDSKARALVAERSSLFETLRRVPKREPPDDLGDSILAAIRSERVTSRGRGRLRLWGSFMARRPGLGFSYALLAGWVGGSLTTLAVLGTLARKPEEGAPTSGTMANPAAGQVVARGRLDLPGVRLGGETRLRGRVVRLHVGGHASGPAEITIMFSPEELRLESIVPPESNLGIEITAGRVRLRGVGEMRLDLDWVSLVPAPRAVEVHGRADGKEEEMILPLSTKAP